MRIKSKNEINFVHIATLAVCPFMSLLVSFGSGMMLMGLSILSFLLSTFVCLLFFKKSNKNVRIFISAFVSALVVVAYEFFVNQNIFEALGSAAYFSILSAVVLSIDNSSYDSEASTTSFFIKIVRLVSVYCLISVIYFLLKELLCFGTIAGYKLLENFEGYEFFKYITFDLMLLALLCAATNRIVLILVEIYNDKKLLYNKYKMKVRSEKQFLYDNLRRKKILTSEIEVNHINDAKFNDEEKDDEENSSPVNEDINKEDGENQPQKEPVEDDKKEDNKLKDKKKKRKKSHLKVSKEAKVEKVFDRASNRKGEDNNA